MKHSLRNRIIIPLVAFAIILNGVCIYMNYFNFKRSNEQFSFSTASTVTATSELIIDKDRIMTYVETGERDSKYYEIWNKLIDYRNTNKDIINLSVVWFDKAGCHYIFDTNLGQDGAFLGDIAVCDRKQAQKLDALMDGEEIGFINYGNYMDVYRPILSSYNIPIGYVIVSISTLKEQMEQKQYLFTMVVILFLLSVGVLFLLVWLLHRTVIGPINMLSGTAYNYVHTLEGNNTVSAFEGISIKTGDEIERLFVSLKKMETDLLNSTNDLAVARWNSEHDSMTQLYNKRYLYEYMQKRVKGKSVAAFYFDVDNLKKMNDICGHEAGDEVICKTAEFIKKYQSQSGRGFRMGGDEFVLIVYDITKRETEQISIWMKEDSDRQLTGEDSKVSCRIAMGYAYVNICMDLDALLKEADEKMYQDKLSHRE